MGHLLIVRSLVQILVVRLALCMAACAISVWMGECCKVPWVVSRLVKRYTNASPFIIYSDFMREQLCDIKQQLQQTWWGSRIYEVFTVYNGLVDNCQRQFQESVCPLFNLYVRICAYTMPLHCWGFTCLYTWNISLSQSAMFFVYFCETWNDLSSEVRIFNWEISTSDFDLNTA